MDYSKMTLSEIAKVSKERDEHLERYMRESVVEYRGELMSLGEALKRDTGGKK